MLETTGDLATFVLRASGINGTGQTPLAEDSNTALEWMRMTIAEWQRRRWMVWNEQELSIVANGNNFYTIGPGQDFAVARPDRIHAAWCRLQPFGGPNPVDLPLQIIMAKEDWATITIKDLKSIPTAVFYDSAFPIGRIYFWPVPSASHYEMHIVIKAGLPVYTSLTDPIGLPDEYLEAMVWTLCVKMEMSYDKPLNPAHVNAMIAAMNVIRMANTQIGLLSLPPELSGRHGDVSSWIGKGLNRAWTVGGDCVLT